MIINKQWFKLTIWTDNKAWKEHEEKTRGSEEPPTMYVHALTHNTLPILLSGIQAFPTACTFNNHISSQHVIGKLLIPN